MTDNAKPTPEAALSAWNAGKKVFGEDFAFALREAISQRDLALSERNTVSRLCNLRADERDQLAAEIIAIQAETTRQTDLRVDAYRALERKLEVAVKAIRTLAAVRGDCMFVAKEALIEIERTKA